MCYNLHFAFLLRQVPISWGQVNVQIIDNSFAQMGKDS